MYETLWNINGAVSELLSQSAPSWLRSASKYRDGFKSTIPAISKMDGSLLH